MGIFRQLSQRAMALHRRWFPRGVRSDDGYEVAFVGSVPRGRKLRYSEGSRSITFAGEQSLIVEGTRRRWGFILPSIPDT
jgi:hypothetical protein